MSVSKSGGRARDSCARLAQGGEKVNRKNCDDEEFIFVFFLFNLYKKGDVCCI